MTDERVIWDYVAKLRKDVDRLTKTVKSSAKYAIPVMAANIEAPTDGATFYFGGAAGSGGVLVSRSRMYVPIAGTITAAYVYGYAITAGSAQNWPLYITLNGTTDTTIATVAAATNGRLWSNAALSIPVVAGDYIEIKSVNPTWVTNPENVRFGGTVLVR